MSAENQPEADLSEFHLEEQIEELKQANGNLSRQLRRAKARSEDLVAATYQGARDAMIAMGPMPKIKAPQHDKGRKRPMVALLDMGDWQGAKETISYNSSVMEMRVDAYVDKVFEITELERSVHPVRMAHLILGGDMVEGLFNFPTQVYEVDKTLHDQWLMVSRLITHVVRRLLGYFEYLGVTAEWGNHGRIGSRRASVPRADNFDRMCYTFSREMLAGEERLSWDDCLEDIQRLVIGNYRALVCHGDEVGRNGYVAPDTFMKHIVGWRSGSFTVDGEYWPFRDCYVHHYHQHRELPMPNGEGAIYWTGSTESDNRYARDNMAATAMPTQRLHFIDPDKGRVTSQHKIWLPYK